MSKEKSATATIQTLGNSHPEFVTTVINAIRTCMNTDNQIRVRTDASAKNFVIFSAQWADRVNRPIDRRVLLETKRSEDGKYSVVFMAKMFDENSVAYTYDEETFTKIATDTLTYLRVGTLPKEFEIA